jgi:Cdc6-like AAA superfamily ATPase
MTTDDWNQLSFKAGRVFTPAAPVDEQQLFAGRIEQLRQVLDVVSQKGQHAIIFGERGVGKTSLANILAKFSGDRFLAVRKNCDTSDDYSSLWNKVFSEIVLTQEVNKPGFTVDPLIQYSPLCDTTVKATPESVRQTLTKLANQRTPLIILDEFDRISTSETRATMADTIKMLSDHAIPATIILVGVADSVDGLIKEHLSIERALVQIKMPRMSNTELKDLIDRGLKMLKMSITGEAKDHITLLCQGLPHYTHLLTLHSVRQALDSHSKSITLENVESAISKALEQAQQTTQSAYHKAIMSPRKENIFAQVLLACALTRTDDLGYFAAADVRRPLSMSMKRTYEVPGFSRHLNDFCDPERGPILNKIGKIRRYRFRFVNPLMQPFVVMQGFTNRLIDRRLLESLKAELPQRAKTSKPNSK